MSEVYVIKMNKLQQRRLPTYIKTTPDDVNTRTMSDVTDVIRKNANVDSSSTPKQKEDEQAVQHWLGKQICKHFLVTNHIYTSNCWFNNIQGTHQSFSTTNPPN